MPRQRKDNPERKKLIRMTGQRIKQARLEIGMNQPEMAGELGWTRSGWSDVELGINSIDPHDLQKIAELTGYTVDFFVNPNYNPLKIQQPTTMADWDALYPDDHGRARAHYDLDRAWNARPTLDH